MSEEIFNIVNDRDEVVGQAPRSLLDSQTQDRISP
jgi:hypothetical protein